MITIDEIKKILAKHKDELTGKYQVLEYRLEELLGVKVDLVSKNALKPRIGERILSEVVYVQ